MPDKPRPPLALGYVPISRVVGRPFFKEEAETTVGFGVDFAPVHDEALRYHRFELRHGARARGGDVRGAAGAAVHDEGAFIHACLGDLDEFLDSRGYVSWVVSACLLVCT